jgi:hypothetical protein
VDDDPSDAVICATGMVDWKDNALTLPAVSEESTPLKLDNQQDANKPTLLVTQD